MDRTKHTTRLRWRRDIVATPAENPCAGRGTASSRCHDRGRRRPWSLALGQHCRREMRTMNLRCGLMTIGAFLLSACASDPPAEAPVAVVTAPTAIEKSAPAPKVEKPPPPTKVV